MTAHKLRLIMSPIPERDSISPEMFTELKGTVFSETHRTIDFLSSDVESIILQPPNKVVVLNNHFIPNADGRSTSIKVSEAVLFRGKDLDKHLDFFSRYIPKYWRKLRDENPFNKLFGINTSFDEEKQIISVWRDGLPKIKFQHSGLINPIKQEHRYAILALAITPDKLWRKIHSRGFVFGSLRGNDYKLPWKAVGLSSNLPKQKIDGGKRPGRLSTFSVESLYRAKKDTKPEIFASFNPIGIFIDERNS